MNACAPFATGYWRPKVGTLLLTSGLLGLAAPSMAAEIRITLIDSAGKPLADAVAYATPTGAQVVPSTRPKASIDQISKRFVPLVSVIQVGTPVLFPNKDDIRHEVYSFSPAKVFKLKLYSGVPADPVIFDKPGEVTLGCNIHDRMIAYVYVVETPFFGKSGIDGTIRLADLPTGPYTVRVAHPWFAGTEPPQNVVLKSGDAADLRYALDAQVPAKSE